MAALPLMLSFCGAGHSAAAPADSAVAGVKSSHHFSGWKRSSSPTLRLHVPRSPLPLPPRHFPVWCTLGPGDEAGGGEQAHDGGDGDRGNNGRQNGGNDDGGGGCWWDPFNPDGRRRPLWRWGREANWVSFLLGNEAFCALLPLLCVSWIGVSQLSPPALARSAEEGDGSSAWEVRGGKWTRLVPDPSGVGFVVVDGRGKDRKADGTGVGKVFIRYRWLGAYWNQLQDVVVRLMLPEGFPESVTSDYLEYSLWRGIQGIASQVSGVLSTQALLYAVGLGKGAIPTAAAINWVLKDGIGYLSKIMLSKYGRHFDVNPKGWRLFADFLENAAYGMEILTPAFPHLFVIIGAAAGASRSASALIQAATRSCFHAGFAAKRNFAEVIAKGEAQGMVSKFLGIVLGIGLANLVGSSTSLALAAFGVVTGVHMYCNLKSYQSIQLRTLNPYRASLLFSEYLLSGQVPAIKEVNGEEPIFPDLPIKLKADQNGRSVILSAEAKDAALQIVRRLHLGSRLSELVKEEEDVVALFNLFRNESYMLVEHQEKFCVIYKEETTPEDMLKSLFHVNYLYWLEKNLGSENRKIVDECRYAGRLQISLDYVRREFSHIQHDGKRQGWATDGLIARPLPNRIRIGLTSSEASGNS